MKLTTVFCAVAIAIVGTTPVLAAKCGKSSKGFNAFKKDFAVYAKKNGVGRKGLSALASSKYSTSVIKFDRAQRKSFKKGFNAFYKLRTTGLARPAKARMRRHARLLNRVEKQYGVQKEVLVTIWGMETGFGGYTGKYDIINSLATLTHDCRRSGFFRPNLLAALQIVDRGWMQRKQMRGARHGEIGQTQFMAKNYVAFGVDYDRNGRRDLVRSIPDVMASTANYLRGYGWRAGGSYQPGSHNYAVLKQWNAATVYQKAIAKFAASIAD